jgi:hypothetical protein
MSNRQRRQGIDEYNQDTPPNSPIIGHVPVISLYNLRFAHIIRLTMTFLPISFKRFGLGA